jgi:glycosyltransferase A (GT-A) superfamily protein (DUF2064 family)/SAM-dependent methyltransferase
VSHVLVMAKAPVAGLVKTRLCPPLTFTEAADVAAAALADTLDAVAACGADRRIVALDGEPGPWLPPGFDVIPQCRGGLDRRLAAAWARAGGPGVQIGMDTPQVTPALLDDALARVAGSAGGDRGSREGPDGRPGADAVLGLAPDGGWWAVGLRRPDRRAFRGVPMSTAATGAAQLDRLRRLGLRVDLLDRLNDIDTAADLAHVAGLIPGSRTGAVAAALCADERARRHCHCAPGHPSRPCAHHHPKLVAGASLALRAHDGSVLDVGTDRWHGPPTAEDETVLAGLTGPVLDVGCGPGRAVLALGRRGVVALGIDSSPRAVAVAHGAGASVLQRSVFDPMPGIGRWRTALLLDGNVGIGGAPVRLLRRLGDLLAPGGEVVAEVAASGRGCRMLRARLERDGQATPWFPWAVVGADAVPALAAQAGLHLHRVDTHGERHFARLSKP